MGNRYDARPRRDDGPPTWQPQPGEVLAGVIDRYTVSETPQGFVRTVIVTEARIDVRYRWRAPDHGYQRWRLLMDRPETLDLSPLGGEVSDEAPWHPERRVAVAAAGSTPPLQEAV
jgi:hypothetical protein